MKKHIIQFFKFLEDKEGKPAPLKVKFVYPNVFKLTKEQLNVKGSLDLSETNIKELPKGLQVGVNLNLEDCTSLKELPQDLKVGRYLSLVDCKSLKELPQGLKVGKDLFLRNTPIAEKYSEEQIRSMIEDDGGYVKGRILKY